MLRVMLMDLWRRNAWMYVVLASLATIAPLRLAMAVGAIDGNQPVGALELLRESGTYGPIHAVVAVLSGLLLGAGVWLSDQTAGHVYALTLPTPRWHYALLRFASGATVVAGITAAFWFGALIAASLVTLPVGVFAYPTALTVRFALTALVAFSLFFALSALTKRTAGAILGLLAALFIVEFVLSASGSDRSLIDMTFRDNDWLIPAGRWMLFDV